MFQQINKTNQVNNVMNTLVRRIPALHCRPEKNQFCQEGPESAVPSNTPLCHQPNPDSLQYKAQLSVKNMNMSNDYHSCQLK